VKFIESEKIPKPKGHYSHAVKSGNSVYVSGQFPSCSSSEDFKVQVKSALERCSLVLEAAGCSLRDVVQTTAYIEGVSNWASFNEVYANEFGEHKPARVVVPVSELHYGYKVEIQMIASVEE
jgi:reactive intermediate/imine deaminase